MSSHDDASMSSDREPGDEERKEGTNTTPTTQHNQHPAIVILHPAPSSDSMPLQVHIDDTEMTSTSTVDNASTHEEHITIESPPVANDATHATPTDDVGIVIHSTELDPSSSSSSSHIPATLPPSNELAATDAVVIEIAADSTTTNQSIQHEASASTAATSNKQAVASSASSSQPIVHSYVINNAISSPSSPVHHTPHHAASPSAVMRTINIDNVALKTHNKQPSIVNVVVTNNTTPTKTDGKNTTNHQHTRTASTLASINTTLSSSNTTLNTTASLQPRKAYLKTIPQEVLSLISTFLDARTLSRMNSTDRSVNSLTNKKELWNQIVTKSLPRAAWLGSQEFDQAMSHINKVNEPKKYFISSLDVFKRKKEEKLVRYQKDYTNIARAQRGFMCHCFNDLLIIPIVVCLFLIFAICLTYQLQTNDGKVGDESMTNEVTDPLDSSSSSSDMHSHGRTYITWFSFWPVAAIGFILLCSICTLCYSKWFGDAIDHEDNWAMLPRTYYSDSASVMKDLIEEVNEGEKFHSHVSVCCVLMMFLVFVVLLAVKLTSTGLASTSWHLILLPLYIVFFFLCCTPCLKWGFDPGDSFGDRTWLCLAFWVVLGIPLLVFTILLNCYLEEVRAVDHVMWLMIPLFYIDLISLVGALFVCYQDETYWSMGLWFCVDAPFVVFKILLALYLDGNVTNLNYVLVFIPLYLSYTLIICGCVWLILVQHDNMSIYWESKPKKPELDIPQIV